MFLQDETYALQEQHLKDKEAWYEKKARFAKLTKTNKERMEACDQKMEARQVDINNCVRFFEMQPPFAQLFQKHEHPVISPTTPALPGDEIPQNSRMHSVPELYSGDPSRFTRQQPLSQDTRPKRNGLQPSKIRAHKIPGMKLNQLSMIPTSQNGVPPRSFLKNFPLSTFPPPPTNPNPNAPVNTANPNATANPTNSLNRTSLKTASLKTSKTAPPNAFAAAQDAQRNRTHSAFDVITSLISNFKP